ncbi:MAG: hypothetical protein ACTHKT_02890 [Solirubrobacterales bacterium]
MQAERIPERSRADRKEEAVLLHVLEWQPTTLRMCDLVRELAKPDDFDSRDEVEQATQHLVRLGLLYRQGECVLPTPAAVYVQGWELG